jgi:hypothetical protein
MHLPGPIRAAVGLVAAATDEARHLPDRALELPMLAVSTALQASVRAQQRYARLTARGDALLNRQRPTDEPPAWATFDDAVPAQQPRSRSPFDDAGGLEAGALDAADTATAAAQMIGDLFGVSDPAGSNPNGAKEAPSTAADAAKITAAKVPAAKVPAKKAPARKSPAKKTPAKKAAAKKSSAAGDAGD